MCLEDFVELTEVSIYRRICKYQNARYVCATVSAVLVFVFKYKHSAWNKVRQAMQTCNFWFEHTRTFDSLLFTTAFYGLACAV